MSPEEEIVRAGKARQIIEADVFKEAVKTLETALLAGIQASAFKDDKLREKLCQRYAVLQDLVAELRGVMETGLMAEETIRRRTLTERFKDFIN